MTGVGVYTLIGLGLGLVVAGVATAIGANVQTSVNTSICQAVNCSVVTQPSTIIGNSMTGLTNLTAQFGTIGTVAAAIVVIDLLLMMVPAFGGRDGAGV